MLPPSCRGEPGTLLLSFLTLPEHTTGRQQLLCKMVWTILLLPRAPADDTCDDRDTDNYQNDAEYNHHNSDYQRRVICTQKKT